MTEDRLIIALDCPGEKQALEMVSLLGGMVSFYKVGLELYAAAGPGIVEKLKEAGHRVFLDLKFFDIPATMARAARAVTGLGVDIFNLHLLAGVRAARAAREAALEEAAGKGLPAPMVIGVTVLTSSAGEEWAEIGFRGQPAVMVESLSERARESGLDGVVASAGEAFSIKKRHGPAFRVITPGIRLPGSPAGDQARIMSPSAALEAGSDYLVIGRPVTSSPDPAAACRLIIEDCRRARAW